MKSFSRLVGAMCLALPMVFQAQADYPNKPVKLIIPFPPGGGVDIVARVMTNRLSEMNKQQFIAENRGGAAGVLATDAVARSVPDGYTLLFGTSGGLVINPLITTSKLPYDPIRDFAPVSLLYTSPMLATVVNNLPIHSIKDLVAYAKANPGKLNYATAGIGAPNHVATELFKYMTGTDMVHVPFKGFGPGITDMMGGQVQVMLNPVTGLLPYVKSGKVRALGVSAKQRVSALPDVPTITESGVPGYEYELWYSIVAPAKTPPAIVNKLNADIQKILAEPDTAQRFTGGEPRGSSPEGLAKLIRDEFDRIGKVVKAAKITAD
jgi:tripartite-type tricarboxylate transporter receptor subunit TctC